jgi:hypothetical protein
MGQAGAMVSALERILVKQQGLYFPPPLLFVIAPVLEEEKNRMIEREVRSANDLFSLTKIA